MEDILKTYILPSSNLLELYHCRTLSKTLGKYCIQIIKEKLNIPKIPNNIITSIMVRDVIILSCDVPDQSYYDNRFFYTSLDIVFKSDWYRFLRGISSWLIKKFNLIGTDGLFNRDDNMLENVYNINLNKDEVYFEEHHLYNIEIIFCKTYNFLVPRFGNIIY